VARLFGDPPINLFEVTPRVEGDALAVDIGGLPVRLDDLRPEARPELVGRACVLGVRPEDVLFSTEQRPGALPVALEAVMPFNVRTVTLLRAGQGTASTEILASRPEDAALAARRERLPGWASLAPGRAMFFDRATGARL
jgi:multiple sugar transport system ATP-binding protein